MGESVKSNSYKVNSWQPNANFRMDKEMFAKTSVLIGPDSESEQMGIRGCRQKDALELTVYITLTLTKRNCSTTGSHR